ncbi:hypothetical protein [Nocardioides terrisoli]|uniref:hypothetical protein n=1 Tax=Nocardioides terrisoli TaxID=3388267 RepID=UPI00287B765B|nr:hypothetical protein [Nocardioides marmorisolisilvae]
MGSPTHAAAPAAGAPRPGDRRVRHGVRDGVAVMLFSAATSVALAALLLLVTQVLAGPGN